MATKSGRLPLSRLLTPHGEAKLVRKLGLSAIRELLREEVVRFVVADVGHSLQWHSESDCLALWKEVVQPRLAEPGQRIDLQKCRGEYAYFATRWDDGGSPIVLLSKVH